METETKGTLMTNYSNYALRLQNALKAEAERMAKEQGTTLNQLINVAVAEKLSALRTLEYIKSRAERGKPEEALMLLASLGNNDLPQEGDQL